MINARSCSIRFSLITKTCVLLFAVMALSGCSVFDDSTASGSTDLLSNNSRYIYMSPIDDGGKSSGPHAVTVCLPSGYDSTDRRYPVIYILDGESAFMTRQNGMTATIAY